MTVATLSVADFPSCTISGDYSSIIHRIENPTAVATLHAQVHVLPWSMKKKIQN